MPRPPDATASNPSGWCRWRSVRAARWLVADDLYVAAGMLALIVYYAATFGVFQGKASGDGWFGFQYLHAIVFKHTLDMQTVLPQYVPYFGLSGPGHHMPNRCPFGPVLVWMPFYLAGVGLHWLAALWHLAPPLDGESRWETWSAGLGTLAGVLVGWRYTYALVERHAGRWAARLGSTAAVWATPIAWYAVTQPCYQHGLAFMTTAMLIERWDATRGDAGWPRALQLGLIGGLGMSFRAQEGLWLLLPGLEAAWHVVRGPARRTWLSSGLVLTAGALLAFAPQMMVWAYYTGLPWRAPQVEPLRWDTPFVVVTLFSTRSGLFPWTPVTYLAVVGLAVARRGRRLAWELTALFALEVYIVACAWVLTGGYGYGARRLSDGVVWLALAVGLAFARTESRRWLRALVAVFVGACIAGNVLGMELMRQKVIPSSGAYARSMARTLEELHAPRPLVRLMRTIGYPFVQPAGWLFALAHHAPVTAFEGIEGNWFLDRDGQWMTILTHDVAMRAPELSPFAIDGLRLDGARARVVGDGKVRLLLPMFAAEPIGVHLVGQLATPAAASPAVAAASPAAPSVSGEWNGVPLERVSADAGGVRFEVRSAVRAGVNELVLQLPPGSSFTRMEFQSLRAWFR